LFRTQLSSDLIIEKALIALVWLITFFCWTSVPGYFLPFITLFLAFIFCLYSIYIIYFAAVNASYDSSYLFVTDRKTEIIISLKSIACIEQVYSYKSFRKKLKITYTENGVDEELALYPKGGATELARFINAVKAQNSLVITP